MSSRIRVFCRCGRELVLIDSPEDNQVKVVVEPCSNPHCKELRVVERIYEETRHPSTMYK